ncbi:MAG: TspO/MBR family protein [Methanocorpusculum sp.]|nr:TspO/MBR family protein [Methanocorpusculum sp.]
MPEKMHIPKWYLFAAGIAVSLFAGILGSLVTPTGPESWFVLELIKPVFQPPAWLFAPVWTILYILMGAALAFVLAEGWDRRIVKISAGVFAVQLVLNVLWSYLFFGWHNLIAASVEIVMLWASIAVMIWLFAKVSRPAAYLLIPYILWVTFATVLTITIAVIN